ncbi:lactonase family protein [Sediminibacterium soli]|uniref:lactonase family protein n=1 Tax=Sediminibacterium soli TaxID=2698829 RepID=UPI00137AC867|nr:lactonase family protein [Sediminibacterium soli]NCI46976.1 lactonase family protein [Sediminibacterium soli]
MRSLLAAIACTCLFTAKAQEYHLFVGTYTTGESKGIYVYKFNAANGRFSWVSSTDSCTNPSYLALSPDGNHLYAVNETNKQQPGRVSAFAFDKTTGKLSLLNQQLSGGDDPCFVTTDKKGKWVVVGNYSGGNLAALPVRPDGSLAPYAQLIQHTGSGANKARQEKAHVHATFFSPDGQYVFAPDLGMDKVMGYRFRSSAAQPLSPAIPAFTPTAPGSGPRHLVFHPKKNYVYLVEELTGTVAVFIYRGSALKPVQTIATHPADFKGQPGSADIHVSPDGKFLYASNRGDENNLAIFSIGNDGKLTTVGYQSVLGMQPRNFIIDPTGRYLLVANQKTSNIVVFSRDRKTGKLQALPEQIKVPNPVCLKLLAD